MKIVVNKQYGGFDLSYEAIMKYAELSGIKLYAYTSADISNWQDPNYIPYNGKKLNSRMDTIIYSTIPTINSKLPEREGSFSERDIVRNDINLVKTIELLGSETCSTWASKLQIVEIPDDVEWEIGEYDGMEWVDEKHRSW